MYNVNCCLLFAKKREFSQYISTQTKKTVAQKSKTKKKMKEKNLKKSKKKVIITGFEMSVISYRYSKGELTQSEYQHAMGQSAAKGTGALAGGSAGAAAGAAIGNYIGGTLGTVAVPGLGTFGGAAAGAFIGGIIGGIIGGVGGAQGAKKIYSIYVPPPVLCVYVCMYDIVCC